MDKWEQVEAGWYWHDKLGGVVFESAGSAPYRACGPRRGWWWHRRDGSEQRGPFNSAQEAKQTAEDWG